MQYGVLGIFAILLLLARIVPWQIYQEKKAEIDRLNAELAKERANTDAVRQAKDSEIGARSVLGWTSASSRSRSACSMLSNVDDGDRTHEFVSVRSSRSRRPLSRTFPKSVWRRIPERRCHTRACSCWLGCKALGTRLETAVLRLSSRRTRARVTKMPNRPVTQAMSLNWRNRSARYRPTCMR